jgi:hypothetical protein
MSFKEKNITVSLFSFILILIIYLIGIWRMVASGGLESTSLFRLWGLTIVLAIVFTIIATILTHIITAIIEVIRTGEEDPEIDDLEDERDQLIDLKGTRITYAFSSIGVFLAMLTFVLGHDPLVMFSLLILAGLVAQIVGDSWRLNLYRRGF